MFEVKESVVFEVIIDAYIFAQKLILWVNSGTCIIIVREVLENF